VAGHPAVLMPVAAIIASRGFDVAAAFWASLACAAVAMGYCFHKVRRGEWTHIDASVPAERAQFNVRAGLCLLAAAGTFALAGLHIGIPLVAGLSGLVVLAAHLLRGLAKLSLHTAFAVFAATLVWPHHTAVAGFAAVAIAVGWSRLALRRHSATDIALGALAGVSAGLLFQGVARLSA
jgi:membrane-associated phospholipid phosphatase